MAALSPADCAPWASGTAHRTSFALAEWLCRTADRIEPASVCGPHHCFGRGASAPDTQILCQILQPCQNASISEQGCAGFSPGSANRCDQVTRHPGRTSSPLRPCLSFRYTQCIYQENVPPKRAVCFYFFFPDPSVGCHPVAPPF